MAIYDPSAWPDAQNRGGVTGTTTPPPISESDPNGESAQIDWSRILDGNGGVVGGSRQPQRFSGGGDTPTTSQTDRRAGIAAAYQKYLGRDISEPEYQYWIDSANYESGIAGSAEARQRATNQAGTPPPTSTPPSTPSGPPQGMSADQWNYQRQALINAYWKYLYRLPDQSELDAFSGKGADQFNAHLRSIPTSWESRRIVQERGGKLNEAPVPTSPTGGAGTTTPGTGDASGAKAGSLAWVQQQLANYKSTDDPNYWVRVMAADPKVAAGDQSAIDYWLYRMSIGDGAEDVRMGRKKTFDHGGPGGGFPVSGGANAFNDPATSQWESLVRQLTDRLNNPMPDSAKELQQTQALDPLERQRQTMRQQESLRLSQRGIQPGSGVYDDAMRNIDKQFNELRTRTQAGFANSWAQNEDNRMMQAANLFKQIPQYQDSRLTLAQNTLIPTNVGSLLNLQQQGNQWSAEQQQAFWTQLANALSGLFR